MKAAAGAVLFVGGTPLYLKALLRGLFDGPPANEELRRRLTEEAERLGAAALHTRLAAVDAVSAGRLHPNDVRRVIRRPGSVGIDRPAFSAWQTQWGDPHPHREGAPPHIPRRKGGDKSARLVPESAAEELYARIEARVRRMIADGLVEEVRRTAMLAATVEPGGFPALGYKEMFDHLDGRAGLEETITRIQRHSRNFAKRQLTWFRSLPECLPVRDHLTFAAWGITIA